MDMVQGKRWVIDPSIDCDQYTRITFDNVTWGTDILTTETFWNLFGDL